jgi:hypothetical protein
MTRRLAWPEVACASGAVLDLFVLTGTGGPVRVVLAVWFLFACTGMSIVPALGIPALGIELLIGVVIGLLIDTLVAAALAAAGALTAVNALVALEAVCLLGTALTIARGGRELRWPR